MFDFNAKVDLFVAQAYSSRGPVEYRSFTFASHAIRYVMEELPPEYHRRVCIETEDDRLNGARIKELYESDSYPLPRTTRPVGL